MSKSLCFYLAFLPLILFARNDDLMVPQKIEAKFSYLKQIIPLIESQDVRSGFSEVEVKYQDKKNILSIENINSLIGDLKNYYRKIKQMGLTQKEIIPFLSQIDSIILHLIYQKDLTIHRAKEGNTNKTAKRQKQKNKKMNNHQVYFSKEVLPSSLMVETPIRMKQSGINNSRVAKKNAISKLNKKRQKVLSATDYKSNNRLAKSRAKTERNGIKNSIKKSEDLGQVKKISQVNIRKKLQDVRQKIKQISAKNLSKKHQKPVSFFSGEILGIAALVVFSFLFVVLGTVFIRRKSKSKKAIDPVNEISSQSNFSEKSNHPDSAVAKVLNSAGKNLDFSLNPGFVFTESGDLHHYNLAAVNFGKKIDINLKKANSKNMRTLYFRLMTNLREDKSTGQKVLKVDHDFYTYQAEYKEYNGVKLKVVELIPYFRGKDERFEVFQNSPIITEISEAVKDDSQLYSLDDFLSSNLMGIHMIFEMNRVSLQYTGNEGKEIFVGFSKKDLETIFTSFMVSIAKVLGQREQTSAAILSTDALSDRLYFKVSLPKYKVDKIEMEKAFSINDSSFKGLYEFFQEISERFSSLGLQINMNYLYGEKSEFLATELNLSFKTVKETSKQLTGSSHRSSKSEISSQVKVMPTYSSFH